MEYSIGETIQNLINERDEAIRRLSEARIIFQNNMRLKCVERDEMERKYLVSQEEIKKSNQKIIDLQKLAKLDKKEIERLQKDVVKQRKYLRDFMDKTKKETLKRDEKRNNPSPLKDYDVLRNAKVMTERVDKGITAMRSIAGQTHSKFFYRHVCERLDNQQLQKFKFTAYESFQLYHDLNFTRSQMGGLKKWFSTHNMMDPFPSLHKIREIEGTVASKEMYTVTQKQVPDGNGGKKTVTTAFLNNVQQFMNDRVQQLIDSEKLGLDGCTKDGIWLAILGDKGADEMKVCIAVGNVTSPNSSHNLIPLGVFNDDESAEKVMEHLGPAVEQLNQLIDVEVDICNERVKIPVQQYLVGDMKFIYSMIGHQGASAACSCLYCYSPGRQKIGTYKRGENCTPRTEDGYLLDSNKCGAARKSVKEGSSFIFKQVPLERIVPSSMHILQGLAQTFGFTILKKLADEKDSSETTPLPKVSQKLKKEGKEEVERAENDVCNIDDHIFSMECVSKSIENIILKTIDDSGIDEGECSSKMCVYRDKIMENADFFDASTLKCNGCQETHHSVCSGVWTSEEMDRKKKPGAFFLCFECLNCNASKRLESSKKLLESLQSERIRLVKKRDDVKQKYEKRLEIWSGNGETRKQLESIWKSFGADISAFKQDFCGNHVQKLLDEDAIKAYCSIFAHSPEIIHIEQFLIHLGKFQKLCVARELTDFEISTMKLTIDDIWFHLQKFASHLNVTLKLHVLLEHTVQFVELHRTLALTSEQSIESIHAIVNRLKMRYRTERDELRRVTFIFRSLLFNTHVNGTC
ncbi:hypothetical protein CRE_18303 [Caenorhabditis remanei]|uniref:Uncharacterized protein n=1 Tax=Caenorhabditis remanei TaxID=31234 RepID=E3NN77_CAERE|nr:hypothetical protein CRE_18303 [Caenorhabditis remanei]